MIRVVFWVVYAIDQPFWLNLLTTESEKVKRKCETISRNVTGPKAAPYQEVFLLTIVI